jgi:acyl-coenzyme A thioesterase PaaI-like protein
MRVRASRAVGSGRIEARARVLRDGRRLVILSVEAADEAGRLVATATTTYVKQ